MPPIPKFVAPTLTEKVFGGKETPEQIGKNNSDAYRRFRDHLDLSSLDELELSIKDLVCLTGLVTRGHLLSILILFCLLLSA